MKQQFSTVLILGIYISIWSVFHQDKDEILQSIEYIYKTHGKFLNQTDQSIRTAIQNCQHNDYLKLVHPDSILQDYYIYRHQAYNDSQRNYIRYTYFDSQPYHEVFQIDYIQNYLWMSPSPFTSMFINSYVKTRERQTTEICLLEQHMHMPAPDSLNNKITIAKYMNDHLERLRLSGKSMQCLNDAQFQKKSYLLDKLNECREFFAKANEEYNYSTTHEIYKYVKKNNLHDQKGTELAFKDVMRGIQEKFDYGKKCEYPPIQLIMQEYINNPVLIKGRKFDIRLHILIVSTNPLIVYIYRTFYLMKCAYKFEHDQFRNQSHICSAGYQRRLFEKIQALNATEEYKHVIPQDQITEAVSYEQFADYLINEGKIKDRSWIDNHMIPQMEIRFHHYFQSYFEMEGEIPDPRFGEYNACEFDVDDQLNFWLLECTTNPNMIAVKGVMKEFQYKMHQHAFPIMIEYQRTKYRKVRNFIALEYIPQQNKVNNDFKQQVINTLRQEVIRNPEFEENFHLIDFQRAQQSCN